MLPFYETKCFLTPKTKYWLGMLIEQYHLINVTIANVCRWKEVREWETTINSVPHEYMHAETGLYQRGICQYWRPGRMYVY